MTEAVAGLSLTGRVALITGGSRGIGKAIAGRLAEAGARVVISYQNDEIAAEETASAIARQYQSETLAMRSDVCDASGAERLIDTIIEKFGRLDIVVCNAGIWEGAAVEDISEELWKRVIDVNLKGTWTVCRAAVPRLKRQGEGGRIVIISSTAGQRGEANVSNYAASKGGQIAFTKSLAVELARHDITVNAVAPGWVETEMTAKAFTDESFRRSVESTIPVGRIATPDDVALPVLFLCSEWARHITGEVLNVNGGSVLCG
ncbi:MAG TPA: SDR family NAD(P)-dependent oxidoreductase [Pyrinomonadaceae bacterium]|jgi:3-oxoacyl-[acyl-carrier protein] reductase|nr:SDR family NAD(P)-dependent oxidoreductase [Pyrinomonadaceae bacterium]